MTSGGITWRSDRSRSHELVFIWSVDIIHLMGGNVAIEDLSTTDRIKLGGILGLYGGLHYTHSDADYASAFDGLFKYSYNSLGELKISSFFGDMWVLDYGTDQLVGRNKRKRI